MIARLRSLFARQLRKRLGFPTTELALSRLRRAGYQPSLALDVGASYGLFADEFWECWPNTVIHCFEPEPEYVSILEKRAQTDKRLVVAPYLVGNSSSKEKEYFFHLGASSLLPSSTVSLEPTTNRGGTRTASMITLDNWCREHQLAPDFLKIDVQGYELEVLKGATEVLASIQVICTEVNYIEIYRGAPLAADIVGWLAERGFALHDVCNFMPRPLDGALWQSDMIFVRHSSAIRKNKEW